MMHNQNLAFTEFDDALSPLREAAAYEALWAQPQATVKTIAEKLQRKHSPHPSSALSSAIVDEYEQLLIQLANTATSSFNIQFIGEADYPSKLLDAKYPVPLLYYQGAWDLVHSPSIAVVGTRNATEQGVQRTRKLVKELVQDGLTIVSGLAKGIDTAAHEAAIHCGGKTIAVIGTSILDCYPPENRALQNKIAQDYLLVSQVPLLRYRQQNYQQNRFFFPERNKTMSALTLGTIIVEAGETSGALIQATAALKQGRRLFILDSCFQNKTLTWPQKFLSQGAIRVSDYQEIRQVMKDGTTHSH
jgi:DNA processing protein